MNKIIETYYQQYLEQSKMTEEQMSPNQRTEMRRAFFAGFGSLLVELKRFDKLSEKEAQKELAKSHKECADFWRSEVVLHGIFKNTKS